MRRGESYFEKRMNGRFSRLFYATWIPPQKLIPKEFLEKNINKSDDVLFIGSALAIDKAYNIKADQLSDKFSSLDIDPGKKPTYISDAQEFVKKFKLNEKFDTVVSIGLLEHVENPQKVIDESFLCLKQGGKSLHWVPFIYRVHASYGDYWRFTIDGLKYLFREYENVKIIPSGGFFSVCVRMFYEATSPLKDIGFLIRILFYPFAKLIVKLDRFTPEELYCRGYFITAEKPKTN